MYYWNSSLYYLAFFSSAQLDCILKRHQNCVYYLYLIKSIKFGGGLERWLNSYEYWLLFQKSRDQFQAPTW